MKEYYILYDADADIYLALFDDYNEAEKAWDNLLDEEKKMCHIEFITFYKTADVFSKVYMKQREYDDV